MSHGLASTFDVDTILALLADSIVELSGAEASLLALFDLETAALTNLAIGGALPGAPTEDMSLVRATLGEWTALGRIPTLSADLGADERANVPGIDLAGFSAAIAPILSDHSVLGTVALFRSERGRLLSETDLSLVKMFAGQTATAIAHAETYEHLRESRDRVQAAHEELKHAQTRLLSAQKMEAIGGLAAGIAHEINTPIQFVSDNAAFIRDAIEVLADFQVAQNRILGQLTDHPEFGDEISKLREEWERRNCEFLLEEVPGAVADTLEGAGRVTEIVRAMKEFAHPGTESTLPLDANRVIETALQVSRGEWKYVADIETDLDPGLPIIEGHPGPLGQVLLVMLVNGAQAIADHRSLASEGKGTIRITTRLLGDFVEIRVADNGPGIPPDIADRIFEPFFTTKGVGKGSGQGLSIAHSVIVDKHNGEIWVEDAKPGAEFVMRLPVS